MKCHFKITYKPKQITIIDTSNLTNDEYKGPDYEKLLTDLPRADSYARKYLKEKDLQSDLYDITTWEEESLVPNAKQSTMIERLDRLYNDICVEKDWDGSRKRAYKKDAMITALPADLAFLKKWYPHYEFKHTHNTFYYVNFNKVENWGDLKLPHIV